MTFINLNREILPLEKIKQTQLNVFKCFLKEFMRVDLDMCVTLKSEILLLFTK